MRWKVAHACVRGSSHVRSGLPNQDAAQCVVVPGTSPGATIAVAAVSDGHGGSRHFRSQIGSSLAVSTAVGVLQEFLQPYSGRNGAVSLEAAEVQQLERRLVDTWLASIASDLENHPLTEEELDALERDDGPEGRAAVENSPLLAYGATLLIAGATESLLLYLQLGDGEILSVDPKGGTIRPLPPDSRLIGNQTTSLCQPAAWEEFRASWSTDPELPALVLLSTDGYANSFRSDEDFLKIGQDYLNILREQGISLLADELPKILKEATEQGSGDDITLAILQRELGTPEAGGAPVRPKLSAASRSALIEQLRAKHSSQQRRLDDLSLRLEKTQRDNRRLWGLILTVVLAVVGSGLFTFRNRIFTHPSAESGASAPGGSPQGTPPSPQNSGALPDVSPADKAPAAATWLLLLNHSVNVTLRKGAEIHESQIHPQTHQGSQRYAHVLEQKGRLLLANDSHDKWTVKLASGKSYRVANGSYVELGAEPAEITFARGITATLTQAPSPAPAERKLSAGPNL